jgi:Domain of unknown function (DUF5668)/Putative adhesin
MHVNRGLVFWGVAFVTAGAVALAIQFGLIDEEAARQAWRFWPVVLIVIGIAVIAARTQFAVIATFAAGLVLGALGGTLVAGWPDGMSVGCGGETDQRFGESGDFGGSATVDLDFNCGELAVSMAEGSNWEADLRHASGARPDVTSSDDSLRIAVSGGEGFIGFADSRQAWDVTLPADTTLDLGISANAASSSLDLAGASFSDLDLDANAGDVEISLEGTDASDLEIDGNAASLSVTVDGESSLAGSVGMNAGSLELCVPDGVAIEIRLEDTNITFSHNLDDSGLSNSGDVWRSGSGTADVRLSVEGNAASFTYNPDGGCS